MRKNIKVGDTITFTTITREGKQKGKRKVIEVSGFGIGVRFNGWNPYWINNPRLDKIIKVERAKKNPKTTQQ
jgi:hypothetical protein